MLDHAVVGIDHAPATDRLVAELRELPRLGVTRLTLVTVLGGPYPQAPEERHRDHYRQRLAELADGLSEVEVATEVRTGTPAAELCRAAAAHDADVIVVGSHGHTPWRDLFLGSTVLDLLRTSPGPVLLLPLHDAAAGTRGGGVLLATDGSDNAAPAERLATALGERLGGTATTVLPPTAADDDVEHAREHLAQAVGAALTPHVERGPLPETIGRLAQHQHADLVVVGARGRNPLTGLLLGSTAEHLLRTTHRPVLLVPTGR
jgi:nucleotide-binding universal stress UspA family protein